MEAQLNKIVEEDFVQVIKREESLFDDLAGGFSEAVVLFGAGNLGRKTLVGLRKVGVEPLAFVDNNQLLWGKAIDGVKVYSPEEAARLFSERAVFVVAVWGAYSGHRLENTRKQLHDLNCAKVVSFATLYWKYPDVFLPYLCLDLPHKLRKQSHLIKQAYLIWFDDASRKEYIDQLRFRFFLDFDGLSSPVGHKQYFPDDLFALKTDEAFVDCGAYDGDTIKVFLDRMGSFEGKIIAFEPDSKNFQKLSYYVKTLSKNLQNKISVVCAGASARREIVCFEESATEGSCISPDGAITIECVSLDDVVGELKPSFIKMDIEGAELDALVGAKRIILENIPILAISVYHKPDHLWLIPLLIKSISDQYDFFLRPHGEEGFDLVCYAIPKKRLKAECY